MRCRMTLQTAGACLVAGILVLSSSIPVTGAVPASLDCLRPPKHQTAATTQSTPCAATSYRARQLTGLSQTSRQPLSGAPIPTDAAAAPGEQQAATDSPTTSNSSSSSSSKQQQVPHKNLLPFESTDAAVVAVAAFILFVAAGAGMGGGPVLVPVYLLLGQFSQSVAVALSNVTILAGSTANVACNARKRHPARDRPMTDWDLILIMEPATILGAVAGSYLNRVVPVWITHLLLAFLLVLMTIRVVQRAVTLHKRENLLRAAMSPPAPVQPPRTAAAAAQVGEEASGSSAADSGPSGYGLQGAAAAPAAASATGRHLPGRVQLAPLNTSVNPLSPAGHLHTQVTGSALCTDAHLAFPYQAPDSPFAQHLSQDKAAAAAAAAAGGGGGGAQAAAAGPGGVTSRQASAGTAAPAPAGVATGSGDTPSHLTHVTSSECRLAYFPPDGVRQHLPAAEWEAAWQHNLEEEEEQEAAAAAADEAADELAAIELAPVGVGPSGVGSSALVGAVPTAAGGPPLTLRAAGSAAAVTYAAQHQEQQQQQQTSGPAPTPAPTDNITDSSHDNIPTSSSGMNYKRPSLRSRLPQLLRGGGSPGRGSRRSTAPEVVAMEQEDALSRLLAQEAKTVPLFHFGWLTLLSATVLVTSVLSKRFPCGSWRFWVTQLALVPVLGLVWGVARRHLLTKRKIRWRAGVDSSGDVQWNGRNTLVFPAICTLAGLMAGMFGLGGAVVKTPLMLELGVHPQVTAATTHTMLLFTTTAATIVYAQMGVIPWDYAGLLAAVALVTTLAGQLCIDRLVKAVGRASLVVVLLSGFFVVACCLTIYIAAVGVVGVVRNPELLTDGGSIC